MRSRQALLGVMVAGALTLTSCGKSTTNTAGVWQAVPRENPQRERIGLRTIKPTWALYSVQFSEENWKTSTAADAWAKKVHRNSTGGLVWEEDYYYSGNTFVTEKGQSWEFISIHYEYSSSNFTVSYVGQDPAVHALAAKIVASSSDTEKKKIADEILQKWGMNRL